MSWWSSAGGATSSQRRGRSSFRRRAFDRAIFGGDWYTGVRDTYPQNVLKAQQVAEFPQGVGVKVDRERAMIAEIGSEVRVHIRKLWRPVEGEPCEKGLPRQATFVVNIVAGRQFHSLDTKE